MTPGFSTVTYSDPEFWVYPTALVAGGPGNSITISDGFEGIERLNQSSAWDGNFAPGERLAWTQLVNSNPMTILFADSVSEFGFQIQADHYGSFIAFFDVFNGATNIGSFSRVGNGTSASDDSAIFLGALATGADVVTSIQVRVTHPSGDGDFAINEVSYNNSIQQVPEPALLTLLGLAGFVGASRLRR
jgi:hypothetical protein